MKTRYPERIICLTEETTEIIYLLGAEDKIVGISGFTQRPPQARKSKPKVSTYLDANYEKIKNLNPDYIFAFSDMQAEIVKNLTLQGHHVVVFNQRSIAGILQNILVIGSIIGKQREAEKLVGHYEKRLESFRKKSGRSSYRPRVYFEEWYEPMISGICWVSELIEIAGGIDIFPELRNGKSGRERTVDSAEIIKRDPEIIIGSWCGKKFVKKMVKEREGWDKITAVKNNNLHEVKSSLILQPGPAALTDGLDELERIICGH